MLIVSINVFAEDSAVNSTSEPQAPADIKASELEHPSENVLSDVVNLDNLDPSTIELDLDAISDMNNGFPHLVHS